MPDLDLDLDALRVAFDRDGFVNAGGLLSGEEVSELQAEMERYADTLFRGVSRELTLPMYAGNLSDDPAKKHLQIAGLWQVSDVYRRLACHPLIARIAAHLARTNLIQLWCDTVQYKPPRDGAPFHWHQDAPYHLSVEPPERLIGAWIALDDADIESGCMWMVPGSYRWGFREPHLWSFRATTNSPENFANLGPPQDCPEAVAEWRPPVPRPVRAGDVHFHHALTWHGSPMNRANRPRRGYSLFLMPEGIRASAHQDARVPVAQGISMTEAGADFPVLYRAPGDTVT